MALFNLNNTNLSQIREKPFKLEKEIQTLIEKNLKLLFNLEFISTEFSIGNYRFDSLAYDLESKAFVIIEYKKDKNFSVIDQGYAYLSVMLNNKAEFILEYNEKMKKPLDRNSIDWSQSKVLFISPEFTDYQRQSIGFNGLPIELWEIKQYENNVVSLNQIKVPKSAESIKKISKSDSLISQVDKEIIVYDEQHHFEKGSEKSIELYNELKNSILNIGSNIEIDPKKHYIAFKSLTNFIDVQIQKNGLKCHLNIRAGELKDPLNKTRNVANIGHYGNGDYEFNLENSDEIPYLISLVKQAYEKNK